jgi:phage terminase large subunit-like protein
MRRISIFCLATVTSVWARKGVLRLAHRRRIRRCLQNASYVSVQDETGNIKLEKERSRERIDGISAPFNALGRALVRDNSRYMHQGRTLLVLE